VSKGGTGKSSLTLNLAAFLGMRLRAQGKTVAIVDSNYQQADTGKYLDVFRPNITKLAADPDVMTSARIREALVHKPELNLSALLGPATPDEANPYSIDAKLYLEAVTLLREHYDYILIDTPVAEKFHQLFQTFALPVADYIIVPVAPSFQTLHNADSWIRAAVVAPKRENGAGIDPSKVGVVLNRAEEGVGCTEDDVRRNMAAWDFIGSIPETVEWKAANNNYDIIAKDNYAELSNAFSTVLYAATGEEVLRESMVPLETRTSLLDRLLRR